MKIPRDLTGIARAAALAVGLAGSLSLAFLVSPAQAQGMRAEVGRPLQQASELLKAASSNVLRFKLDAELPPELAAKARVTGRIVQFPAHNAREIEQYLAAIRQAGLVAEDVEIRKADLEDVFLDVMNESVAKEPLAVDALDLAGAAK